MEDNQITPPPSVGSHQESPNTAAKVYMWRHPLTWVAFASLALLGWQWYEANQQIMHVRQELAKRITDNDNALKEMQTIVRQSKEDLTATQGKLALVDAKIAQTEGQQAALTAMYQEFSQARDARLLNEIDQALSIATQQLQLAGNIPAALIALQSADSRLASIGKTQFLALRKALAHDIEKLKATPAGDVASITLLLESILGRVDNLTLGFEHRPKAPLLPPRPTDMNFFERIGNDIWRELKQLVRIERLDRPDPALLSPAQATFLRENLRLRLLSARLALLQHDQRSFYEDVRQSVQWISTYFDAKDKMVVSTLKELQSLQGATISAEVPKLDETLTALREAQQRSATK